MTTIELPRWDVSDIHESFEARSFVDAMERAAAQMGRLGALFDQHGIRAVRKADKAHRAVVHVKGPTGYVVSPDGDVWTHESDAPGLGVSGSGDVLAGIVGGLLARGAEPLSALLWSVWLHGQAGVHLSKTIGPIGFLAREIANAIPAVMPRQDR